MAKILVTGGYGFIGHNVVIKLKELGHDVTITDTMTNYGIIPQDEMQYLTFARLRRVGACKNYDYDISSRYNMKILFEKTEPDIVIHLASFPRQKVVNNDPALGSRTMIEGLLNLCEQSKIHNVKRFVYISSSMVYGDFIGGADESWHCTPKGQYGIMKLAGEHLVKDYSDRKCFEHTILRPSAVYGPLDVEDRVVSKFLIGAMRGETLKINGQHELLDFTFVDDAAEGIVQASLSDQTANKTYNISNGNAKSLLYAAEYAIKISGKGNIHISEKSSDYPSRGQLSIERARMDFNFNPKVNIENGFNIYYDWLDSSPFWSKTTI